MKQIGTEPVNVVLDIENTPNKLLEYIREVSTDYVTWFRKENVLSLGLQVYRDYFKGIYAVYQTKDNETYCIDLGYIKLDVNDNNCIDFNVNHRIENVKVRKELSDYILNILPNLKVLHDYDYENIMDAITYGDYDMLDDIVGDRDLAELI